MKSHDCYVFLQRLLPIAIREKLTLEIKTTMIEIAQTLKVNILKQVKVDIIVILCKMEQIFSLAFFDIMVHLAVHLLQEAELGGPVQNR
jgi:hypothetical protein